MKPPVKVIPATEIKNRFGDYLGEVIHAREPLLIERHGRPVAVLVGFEEWGRLSREGDGGSNSWTELCKRLADEIENNHPDRKPFSVVDPIRDIRREGGDS